MSNQQDRTRRELRIGLIGLSVFEQFDVDGLHVRWWMRTSVREAHGECGSAGLMGILGPCLQRGPGAEPPEAEIILAYMCLMESDKSASVGLLDRFFALFVPPQGVQAHKTMPPDPPVHV